MLTAWSELLFKRGKIVLEFPLHASFLIRIQKFVAAGRLCRSGYVVRRARGYRASLLRVRPQARSWEEAVLQALARHVL